MGKTDYMLEQNHPLYSKDRDQIDRLLAKESPDDSDLVDLARLFLRYEDFPGAADLQDDMSKTLRLWGLSRQELNEKTRRIWKDGFRPGSQTDEVVGSGFDTSDNDGK